MQAWKKASNYIRQYNWFADTLELDETTVNLRTFIGDLIASLRTGKWESDPLRLVAAPKSQQWGSVDGRWMPLPRNKPAKIRPLAHASIRDQVMSTAIMLLLADRVETAQGDPRLGAEDNGGTLSYGNRLFCDAVRQGESLRHRWGSTKLYRGFFHDYRTFLAKPEHVADQLGEGPGRTTIVQSDLAQFYDRVSPDLLHAKIRKLQQPVDDPAFFDLACQVMSWRWHARDEGAAKAYAEKAKITGNLERVALPQGLVASGFFANLVLLDFDEALADARGRKIADGIHLHDVVRYVDDLRLVLTTDFTLSAKEIEGRVSLWLNNLLSEAAPGLEVSDEKTEAAFVRGESQPLLRQSRRMARIQTAVSGGFDAAGGQSIIEAVQGLLRAQDQFAFKDKPKGETRSPFLPVPDVRSETVNRFAAVRFRKTFRSLRPMLEDIEEVDANLEADEDGIDGIMPTLTKADLDDDARAFAYGLVAKWVADPSNVRLLRIGLDIWPSSELLRQVLELLRPYTEGSDGGGTARKVAQYCLAEILRAGATETGLVPDTECLPSEIDLQSYREALVSEAVRILNEPMTSVRWYLRQQALLCLAVHNPVAAPAAAMSRGPETRRYRDLISFLRGDIKQPTSADFGTLAVLTRRSFRSKADAHSIVARQIDDGRFKQILSRDPAFAAELREEMAFPNSVAHGPEDGLVPLYDVVKSDNRLNSLRSELGVVSFARAFVDAVQSGDLPERISPEQVLVKVSKRGSYGVVETLSVHREMFDYAGRVLYGVPDWVTSDARWRYQLGFLLRFILTAQLDYTQLQSAFENPQDSHRYRPVRSHWYQRIYGLYSGHDAFGDDWLPISQDVQDFLFSLLAWPGCREGKADWVKDDPSAVWLRLRVWEDRVKKDVGEGTGCLFLKVPAPICVPGDAQRPLRACVVQSVTPDPEDYKAAFKRGDYSLDDPVIRGRHRRHLSSAIEAVKKMLALRQTHKDGCSSQRLDWLILPELAVHRNDVQTHLLPFARQYKTIILAGMVFDQVVAGAPLVNSALWIIPRYTHQFGLQTIYVRQGKQHLAPIEDRLNAGGSIIHGFRPAQWLVGYEWSKSVVDDPLWLTASVCYDATDLGLVADLRRRSDIFAIPALNRDVGTFDQMAQALHYHMYQMVIVANNGCFGGSNAHLPKKEPYLKQVFHTHGQPQASISFFELEDIGDMKGRHAAGKTHWPSQPAPPAGSLWKYPPAGFK